jgi:pimeloyl-ACP methyl ester carboxylesterase
VAALAAMREQSFVQKSGAVVIGHSAGGFGALALAARHLPAIAAIIAFAPGRGGHADDRPGEVCAPDRLLAAITGFGRGANVPVLWLVAENDSYFPPALSRQLAEAFRRGGAKVAFQVLPPFGSEGHRLAEQDGGDGLYGEVLEKALRQSISPTSPRARREGGERSSPGEGASPRAQTR